jgi:hypothetical protein
LILENRIPLTHVPNGPYCGVFIANSIIEANSPMEIGNALLFAIDEFINDETKDVATALDQSNFLVTELIGKDATYNNLDKFGAHLPYDLLHICSHMRSSAVNSSCREAIWASTLKPPKRCMTPLGLPVVPEV